MRLLLAERFFLLQWLLRLPFSSLSTVLGGAYSLMLDKHAHVAEFVLACDELSTLANWDNVRLLDSEGLGEHLLDRLHRRRRHYKGFPSRRRLLTLK
jgi:hypothetical protein